MYSVNGTYEFIYGNRKMHQLHHVKNHLRKKQTHFEFRMVIKIKKYDDGRRHQTESSC